MLLVHDKVLNNRSNHLKIRTVCFEKLAIAFETGAKAGLTDAAAKIQNFLYHQTFEPLYRKPPTKYPL